MFVIIIVILPMVVMDCMHTSSTIIGDSHSSLVIPHFVITICKINSNSLAGQTLMCGESGLRDYNSKAVNSSHCLCVGYKLQESTLLVMGRTIGVCV